VQRGLLRLFTERDVAPHELIDSADRSLSVFEELHDELGQARAWRLKAQAHYLGRRGAMSAAASQQALSHIRRVGDRFEEREIIEWLAIALLLGPTPAVEARQQCERLRREDATEPPVLAMLLTTEAMAVAMQGRIDEARELRARSQEIMSSLGEWVWIASFWWAHISIWDNDPVGAEHEIRQGYETLKQLGSKSHFSSLAHLLSNAVYSQGRYEEAESLTVECEQASRPNDVHSQILWRSTRAKVLARRGNFEAARLLARDALDFASTTDFYPAHADALMDLAEVHRLAGDEQAAVAAVEEAVQFYELKGNVFAAGRARPRLETQPANRG
jgi:tetratricopeptide (TPR) repeat protein